MARSDRGRGSGRRKGGAWRRADLHLHTPASSDYQEPKASYLDILRQAEVRGLDLIAFTDHNTVTGYAAMQAEKADLELLERLDRLQPDEFRRLREYRRLLERILVLPGFEFTATFGFHILGIFSPETPISYMEHLLLALNVPLAELQRGSSIVGASSDVLTAYRMINQAGGLVIAAHANSSNGVVMRGLDFGGQTKIAYTQDPNLHCLEVTDLDKRGRYTTRRFFEGSKPEYPRAMRCIQGSDAHRLIRESSTSKNIGVGDRVTEIWMEDVSFEALEAVLKGKDFALTRPYRGPATPMDFVQLAREEGPSIVQSFHESMAQRGGHLNRIMEDACAMVNTNGGTIYIGLPADPKQPVTGVREPGRAVTELRDAIANHFSPEPDLAIDTLQTQGKTVVRIVAPAGTEIPYAIDDNRFYVRDESETTLAVRDEIVRLVERRLQGQAGTPPTLAAAAAAPGPEPVAAPSPSEPEPAEKAAPEPRTGVEIVASEKRGGTVYHTVRDLRNGNVIKNVTRSSARRLWHYAITQVESGRPPLDDVAWHEDRALVNVRRRDSNVWYDLALRDAEGVRVFFGVTDSGLNDEWQGLVEHYGQQGG
ncbi:MAG: RNA-binding domain-containing protein [Candidatus Promineifilaceae bacterium]